ncbi:hypothetical protein BAE44_0007030 [Dichanthelium oligosanthes]|uniref:Vesicle transport protein USE1 n=1 Tax=Dichanthelium oligosanthes TaxID=888268 RepID=A0A1E5W3T1_9POAL|nr:hypothetical protein BAE44_0007030 [Dichanthelium oligosanthes]
MGVSRTQVNLLRLLNSAPRQQNQAKLIYYVTTSGELLELLAAETTSEGISSVSKVKLNEYSDKIEELAARLAPKVPDDALNEIQEEYSSELEQVGSPIALSSGLRRRLTSSQVEAGQNVSEKERDVGAPIRLDAEAHAYLEKHRYLIEQRGLWSIAWQALVMLMRMQRRLGGMKNTVLTLAAWLMLLAFFITTASASLRHQSCASAVGMLASTHGLFLILFLNPFHFSVPVLLAGTAADGDMRPRLLRRQLLPARPTAPSTMKEHPEFLRPIHRS